MDAFKNRATGWDEPSKVEMTELFVKEVEKNVTLSKTQKVMEVGAGTGLVGFRILPKVNSIVFEDTSEAMLEVLRNKVTTEANIEIVHGETQLYKRCDIDLIVSCMAFHHIPDIDAVIEHFHSITTSKAKVIIGDLTTEDGSFHRFEPIPHKGFDMEELTKKFKDTGFSVKTTYIYNSLSRERQPGIITQYNQFILIAEKL